MNFKVAIIDLGTNTFHLLIAEEIDGKINILHRERQPVKLGLGGINDAVILHPAQERALTTLTAFRQTISPFGVDSVYAMATSAIRSASNRNEVLKKIKTETGFDVGVITGEQEADFIYRGVRSALDLGLNKSLIIDIGGGSVEFIIGNSAEIFEKRSCDIGAQRLVERFQKSDPIAPREIEDLETFLAPELQWLFEALQFHKPLTLVGSSGTFDTLSDIHCIRRQIARGESDTETPLTLESFHEICGKLVQKNRADRMRVSGMIEMRVDMIVVACLLIRFIVNRSHFESIRVSSYSLKERVLA